MQTISKRNILITILAIALIVFLVISGKKKTASVTPPSILPDTQVVTSWPSTEVKKETITEKNKSYRISIEYPVTESAAINTSIKGLVDEQIASFKNDYAIAGSMDMPEGSPGESEPLTLDIMYTQEKNTTAHTYLFTVSTYTGGAHDLTLTKTFSYTEKGLPITLADLFTNETKGLTAISTYVQNELGKRDFGDSGWIKEGTIPTEENYANFVVSNAGITFIFAPYQVAPYAAGEQKVTVPLSVFKSLASPSLFANR